MKRHRRERRRIDEGSATVELVLATPLLVFILLFVIMCGRLVSAQLDVDAAAHAAARAASLARSESTARADATDMAAQALAGQHGCPTPTITIHTSGFDSGGTVTVTVACQVSLSDVTMLSIGGTRTITASATAPIDIWRSRP